MSSPNTSCPVHRRSCLLCITMGKILVIVFLLLGGACPVQLPSTRLILNSTQKSYDSYLLSCTIAVPEERVTQVHWKERHPDGKYTMIAVQNPYWGNVTQSSYKIVKLNKLDDSTYTLELTEVDKVVCCEIVTYPSGLVQESCLDIEGDPVPAGDNELWPALLGTLVVSGFFIFGSVILLCHICWRRKSTRVLNLRRASEQFWNGNQRSSIPYARTLPSVNLAYEPPYDTDLLPRGAVQRNPTIQPAPGNLLLRARYHQVPPLSSQWPSEGSTLGDPPTFSNSALAPPQRINAVPENSSAANQLYSNVRRHNRPHLMIPCVQSSQNEVAGEQPHSEPFPLANVASSSAHLCVTAPWIPGGASFFPEDPISLQPPRLRVPRTPESPFTTSNPMYHSSHAGWVSQQGNTHFKYQPTTTLS